MYQPNSIDQARILATAHEAKEGHTMSAPLLLIEIHANALQQERRNRQLKNEQFRIARQQHRGLTGATMIAIRNSIGMMLIRVGEYLHNEPTATSPYPKAPITA